MALLYGRAGRLTAKNGGLRPGQIDDGINGGSLQLRPTDNAHFLATRDVTYRGMNWRLGDSTAELREAGGSYMRFFSQAELEADPSLLVDQGIAVDGGYQGATDRGLGGLT